MVMEINNGGDARNTAVNGGGGGRRKSKLNQKKFKQPKRGLGVQKLEEIIHGDPRWSSSSYSYSYPPPLPPSTPAFPTSGYQYIRPTPAMLVPAPGVGVHGANLCGTDYVMDPSVVRSRDGGFRFENCKPVSSSPNYCGSDGCVVCNKKQRFIGGGSSNQFSVTPFRSYRGNHMMADRSSQVTEVMSGPSGNRNGGSSLTEHEFFPAINGGGAEYKRLTMMRMGSPPPAAAATTTTWCGSGTSVAGPLGLQCGEGSCVTAITGNEEGSVSSLDLSLKL